MKTWPERVMRYPWIFILVCCLLIMTFSSSQAQPPFLVFLPVIFSPPPVLLPNGDFESVPIQWIINPDGEQLIFPQPELPEGIIPHSGSHVSWLGDHKDVNHSHNNGISQILIVPVSTPTLRFWRIIDSSKPDCSTSKDQLSVCIGLTGAPDCEPVFSKVLCHEISVSTWSQEVVDLHNYAGQSITLHIKVVTNNLPPLPYNSEVFLDDFTFSNH